MPEKTQQFAQNIARSLIGKEAAHPAQPLIQMQGIRKSYYIGQPNELEILHGIDLTVYPGEFVAIVGESGSGKSTLMNIIGVLDKPTAGEYVLDGVNIHDADDNDLAAIRNRKIGFVFQTYNLIGRQSALKNVELPMLYAGVPAGERTRRAKEWLERVGMGERMRHQPNELSGGQKQRVAIARAMVNEPALILADEPTGALDSQTSRVVMDLFHELHEKYHKTIVLITHQMQVVKDICTDLAVMSHGKVVDDGSILDVFDHPSNELTREFIYTSGNMNKGITLVQEHPLFSKERESGSVYLLFSVGSGAEETLMADIRERFGVRGNIMFGNVDVIHGTPVGMILVSLDGPAEAVSKALAYFPTVGVSATPLADLHVNEVEENDNE